ncbi:unnamed protein product [Toxocara canis]|uniref:Eukaryotic translation initiation factor 4E-binding protein 1 n=1 Tax=Toxocara canis TaxID=6265 RepID=A0A183UR95_TOXCA|nr:unnamed protein product [Toxocara canis]
MSAESVLEGVCVVHNSSSCDMPFNDFSLRQPFADVCWKSNEQQINEVENKSPQKQKTIEQNLKTAEQVAEIKPKDIPKTEKQQQIAKGQLKRGTAEYPTMDDIVSDWDTEATRDKRTRTQTLLDDPPP